MLDFKQIERMSFEAEEIEKAKAFSDSVKDLNMNPESFNNCVWTNGFSVFVKAFSYFDTLFLFLIVVRL